MFLCGSDSDGGGGIKCNMFLKNINIKGMERVKLGNINILMFFNILFRRRRGKTENQKYKM